MADFLTAYKKVLGAEGGWVNDPADSGKETFAGVSRVNNSDWAGWAIIDAIKKSTPRSGYDAAMFANQELMNLVRQRYKARYWDVNRLDEIVSQSIGNELFDTGVNAGYAKAAMMLQEALNLTNKNQSLYPDIVIDGKVGPITINLTNKHPNPKLLYKMLNGLQAEHYIDIMRNNPSQEKFANSWFSRVDFIYT